MKVSQGITIYSRYSKGCPRHYFISIVVHFESTVNEELRTALENGQDIQLIYAKKGDTDNRTGKTVQKDKFLTIKQYNGGDEIKRQATAAAQQVRRAKANARTSEKAGAKPTSTRENMFGNLTVEE